jgi:hypothetical protein
MPHDLPPWRTVYHYFWSWRRAGIWQHMHDTLRQRVRVAAGRESDPSAAILDSQSVRTSEGGGVRGYDAGKKIRGRKPHVPGFSVFTVTLAGGTCLRLRYRRLKCDDERLPPTESLIYIAMIRLMTRRLAAS